MLPLPAFPAASNASMAPATASLGAGHAVAPPLADLEGRREMGDDLPAFRRRHHFRPTTSRSTARSSAWSAASFFSRRFS